MKICFLLPAHWSGNLGGAELQVKYIIDALKNEKGHEIYYICRETTMRDDDGVKIFKVRNGGYLAKYVQFVDYLQVSSLLKKIAPDFIYTRVDAPYVGMAAYYCRKSKCRTVWHIAHQRDVDVYRIKTPRDLIKYLDRKIFEYGVKNADIIIGQAQYQNTLLQKNFGRSCAAIIPNFHPMAESMEKKSSPLKIIWIANIKASKRPEIFLNLAKTFESYERVEFVMIGKIQDKTWEEQLEYEVDQMNNITYLGGLPIEKTNEVLETAHIFVNTSMAEGFPNSFIQAWLRKVAVVSLSIDPDAVIKENDLGYVSESFEQLEEDIRYLINHPEQRKEVAERGFQYASAHYTLSNISRIVEFFDRQPPVYV